MQYILCPLIVACLSIILECFIAHLHTSAFSLSHIVIILEFTRAHLNIMYMRAKKDPKNKGERRELQGRKYGRVDYM